MGIEKVALVTGASRGIGAGIAHGLAELGAKVYLTGRSLETRPDGLDGTLADTADLVRDAGGEPVVVCCDHTRDEDVGSLFGQIRSAGEGLDLLVNNAWSGYEGMVDAEGFNWEKPFWEQPVWRWDAMFSAGVRAQFTASRLAVPLMLQGGGLIVTTSYWAAQTYMGNALYGTAKCAANRLMKDMAHDLESTSITAMALYPGLVKTERVMLASDFMDFSNAETPLFIGRVVARLMQDSNVRRFHGDVVTAAALAAEYGVVDEDGRCPMPLTVETAR